MNTLEQIIQVIAQTRNLDPTKIEGSADLSNDLGLDSLARVEVAMELEDEFHVELIDADLEEARTLADVARLIQNARQQ